MRGLKSMCSEQLHKIMLQQMKVFGKHTEAKRINTELVSRLKANYKAGNLSAEQFKQASDYLTSLRKWMDM